MIPIRALHAAVLGGALALYLLLAAFTVRGVGVVGEVAIGWALPHPPTVLLDLEPAVPAAEDAGLLRAARTRPLERLVFGPAELPLAINAYTGGVADWPARAVRAATGSLTAGAWTPVALGALLLALAHRFLRFHGTHVAAGAAAWVLASDWCFVFYRKVLGGTELLLLTASLLVLWALWSRRWKGGVHGTWALALGAGMGLAAKATFAATLAAFALAALLTRWDHPRTKPPSGVRPGLLAAVVLVCVAPQIVANVHQALLPAPPLASHDSLALQLARLVDGWTRAAPAREGAANLACFLGNPLAFFGPAYGAAPESAWSPLRAVALAVVALGAGLAWRDRAATPSAALLRYLSLAAPLQIGALFVANRDLHHLAQASLPFALLAGLAIDRVAATTGPPRSLARAVAAGVLASPFVLGGAQALARTDAIVGTVTSPSFTEAGQAALVGMLEDSGVRTVVASDYELYGMLEARAPDLGVVHTWGAVARGARGPDVLRYAAGGHYLAVRASAPMVYNWSPDARAVTRAAAEAGVIATPVATLGEGPRPWATLYRVEDAPGPPPVAAPPVAAP